MIILYIILCIASTVVNGLSDTYEFKSTVEAVLQNGGICLGDCYGRKGSSECTVNWEEDAASCTILTEPDNKTPKYTKRYRTLENKICYSNCGKYNETYEWCVIYIDNLVHHWEYCTRRLALKGIQTFITEEPLLPCTDACEKRGETYEWCHTIKEWQKCDPLKKTVVINHMADSEKECATPCDLYNSLPYCYDVDGDWQKCYLNPESTDELAHISKHMRATRAPGVYTSQGYRRCKSTYRRHSFPRTLSVEDIAKKYEENFPTVANTYLDPNRVLHHSEKDLTMAQKLLNPDFLIKDHTDPVISYTIYDTFSAVNNKKINLPLVIRAVITNLTLQTIASDEIREQFNEMYPIDERKNFDEMGHLIPTKLGGRTTKYNIFPRSWRHSKSSLAGWWYLESDIHAFIKTHRNSYAEYTVVVSYDPKDDVRPYRPTGVGVRVRLYHGTRKQADGGSQLCDINGVLITPSTNVLENLYFNNDPDFNCFVDDNIAPDNFDHTT